MGIITKPNSTTNGTTADGSAVSSNFDTIYSEFNGNVDNANIKPSAGIVDSKLAQISTASKVNATAITNLSGLPSGSGVIPDVNLDSTGWVDYSLTSTIIGWTSYTAKSIWYKKIGNMSYVTFDIEGTSNSTTTNFSVANTHSNMGAGSMFAYFSIDKGTTTNCGFGRIQVSEGVVSLYKDFNYTSSTWTNSGSKTVVGIFF